MKDRQRQKVYTWENARKWNGKETNELNEEQCLFITKNLNNIYNLTTRTNFVNGSRRWATCSTSFGGSTITMPREWSLCWSVILHEYAHAITSSKQYVVYDKTEPHGKEFITAFCVLLHKFHPHQPSYKELSQSLRDANIDFEHMESSIYHKKIGRKTIKLNKVKVDKDYDLKTSILKPSIEGKRRTAAGDGFYKPKTKMNRVLCVLDYCDNFSKKPVIYKDLESIFRTTRISTKARYWSGEKNYELITKVIKDHGYLELGIIKYMIKQGLIVATSTQNKG